MHVLIGVDPHQHSHTTAAVDQRGELLAPQRFPASPQGHRALRRFAKGWPQRRWAIEGAAGVGRVLAQQLVANGDQVIDVPAKPAARVRELSVGHGRTHDTGDAVPIAQRRPGAGQRLPQVDVEGQARVLRPLSDRRDDLVATRTQALHRLHRPPGRARGCRRRPAADRRDRRWPVAPGAANQPSGQGPPAAGRGPGPRRPRPSISASPGSRSASRRPSRSPAPRWSNCSASARCWPPRSWARSATSAGFPPRPGSPPTPAPRRSRPPSGQVVRHRLSRAGNRRLNHALYLMAILQLRHPTAGQAHHRPKLAEGKSPKEALGCLKRRLSDAVHRCLVADQQRSHQPAAT